MWCFWIHEDCRGGSHSILPGSDNGARRRLNPPTGVTLIEIMIALVILTVIALGTAASLNLSQSMTANQRLRRLAMEEANGRIEDIRSAIHTNSALLANNYSVRYVDKITGSWRVSSNNCGETFMLGGQQRPLTTTVQFFDVDGSGSDYSCVRLNVRVQYGRTANDTVVLETLASPY